MLTHFFYERSTKICNLQSVPIKRYFDLVLFNVTSKNNGITIQHRVSLCEYQQTHRCDNQKLENCLKTFKALQMGNSQELLLLQMNKENQRQQSK